MHRRNLLAGALLGLGGCLGAPSAGSPRTDTPTPTGTPTPRAPSIADVSFEATGECADPGSAAVEFATADRVVQVAGCIRGANGCTVPVLDGATYDAGGDELRVVVGTEEEGGTDRACTQALVSLGYDVRVAFSGGLPGRVVVVHDGAEGRRTAATATR